MASKSLATKSQTNCLLFWGRLMPRFLSFDEKTATRLRQQLPEQQVFEHKATDAVDYALGSEKDLVTVMPTGAARQAAIAVFRHRKAAKTAAAVSKSTPAVQKRKPVASAPIERPELAGSAGGFRAGGVLGLRDEVVFDDAPPVKRGKQSWWRKFWPEDD